MIPYKYVYFTGCLLFFIPWAFLFWHRKDLRKAMIVMGVIGAIGSFALENYEIIDWWNPGTITGTKQGIEDLLLGFSNAGIATVLYVELTKKRLYKKRASEHSRSLTILIALTLCIFWILFYEFKAGTFLSCIVALLIYSGIMLYFRKDLLLSSTLNGILMVFLVIPIYVTLVLLSPGSVHQIYRYPLVTGIRFDGVPLEEFIFYFIFGFMVALMYEYWQGFRFRKFAIVKTENRKSS